MDLNFNVAFAENGQKSEVSEDNWKNGWVAIVGGVNGVPTAQQFNQFGYIFDKKANIAYAKAEYVQNMLSGKADKSDIPDKLPADGGNANTVGGKHAADFAPATHSHSAADISELANVATSGSYSDLKNRPSSLPANGGNADTLDGKHADDLYYSHYPAETDANNCVANGNYMLMPSAANLPISAYILIAADTSADGTWLMQRAVDVVNPASHYMRLKVNGVWSAWRLIADGGNADTLDGKHAEEFKIFSFIENGAGVTCIEAAQDANNLVRLQIQTNMEIARLFKSTDGGASWTELPLGNAAGVGGYGISDTGKAGIPTITSDYGVMEVGTYIDFHSGNDGKDYNVRIQTGSSGDEKLYVSSSTGLGTVVANLQGNASTADYATRTDNAVFSTSVYQATCSNACLRNISTGSEAASTKTLALGEMYGQYE